MEKWKLNFQEWDWNSFAKECSKVKILFKTDYKEKGKGILQQFIYYTKDFCVKKEVEEAWLEGCEYKVFKKERIGFILYLKLVINHIIIVE